MPDSNCRLHWPRRLCLDGDTIEVLHNTHPERVRLSGIDCPEKGQAYGQKAKQAASALVFGKEATLQSYGIDKYRRSIADVLLSNDTNVNHKLVNEGWSFPFMCRHGSGGSKPDEVAKGYTFGYTRRTR